MADHGPENDTAKATQEILGYLNFSSGTADPRFLKNLSDLFRRLDAAAERAEPAWRALARHLRDSLQHLHGRSEAFRSVEQAAAVLGLVFDGLLPGYRQFHRDLLFHQTDESLFQPFFIGRACEAVLQQGGPWDEADRIIQTALRSLNDYLGHRPVAVLRTQQKIQPYAHEWVRPVPLFIRGAGTAAGPYQELIERALAVLETTEPALLFDAMFDPELLDELALDPRAYDFDHPVNKRPNYLFGQWDLGKLDNSGRCRRFVLQQVSLDAMLQRINERGDQPYDQVLFEEAAVLAGTMLMGSGVSGNRPDAHDSSVTLATLVQHIAAYRDAFYEKLLSRMTGPHAERLRAEALALRQPFGSARQHFNQHLARQRAEQLQRVHLAELFARMGYTAAAARQAQVVPVASARIKCDIQCRLATAQREMDADVKGGPARAAALLDEIEDLLHRGIECGALVDPWNILGFGGQYSLFPAVENSIYDQRVDELLDLVGGILNLHVRIQKESAAAGNTALQHQMSERLDHLAGWWDRFATTEVSSVEGVSARETRESADHVAAALGAWHEAGTAAGDLAFWRQRAEEFRSAKAYALVVDALLEQHDPVAAMALLVQWLSQAEEIPLVEESYSFHALALDWLEELWPVEGAPAGPVTARGLDRWAMTRKFFDYLEANAEDYWHVPRFELAVSEGGNGGETGEGEALEEEENPFSAAYEGVTYRDSTADGFEGEMLEGGQDATDFELVMEAERITGRLTFLGTLAELWKLAAVVSAAPASGPTGAPGKRPAGGSEPQPASSSAPSAERDQVLAAWLQQATTNRARLLKLLSAAGRYPIPPPRGTHESLVEYDRRRGIKEMLLEQIIAICVETADAARVIRTMMHDPPPGAGMARWERPAERVLRALMRGDAAGVRRQWRDLIGSLAGQPLLYVALARGGNPQRIVASRGLQTMLRRLLAYLPRLGLLRETKQLIEAVQEMEMGHPVGPGAITEFDQVFKIGCKAIVRTLVASSNGWRGGRGRATLAEYDTDLIGFLEQTTEALLRSWLMHSRGVRLSVLETVSDKARWHELKGFIERYGHDLFTQRFMNLGNLRAILHEGVENYLRALAEEPGAEDEYRLLAELDGPLSRDEAVQWLTVALEAVVENYGEYVDYNSTTTQSDRGEMLYTLLDFLRLRTGYDRVAWNLQPVVLTHEVLVRSGREDAAEIWRSAVGERTAEIAEDYLRRFVRLNRKYGMRLPSIADRLGERFIRPLLVDRLRALVQPAIEETIGPRPGEEEKGRKPRPVKRKAAGGAFARLEDGIEQFAREVSGAGFDVPAWLEALEQEVERVQSQEAEDEEMPWPDFPVPVVRLSKEEVRRQVRAMMEK